MKKISLLALYKRMTGVGYQQLQAKIEKEWRLNHKSIPHNTRMVYRILSKWGKNQAVLGKKPDWIVAARGAVFSYVVSHGDLFAD